VLVRDCLSSLDRSNAPAENTPIFFKRRASSYRYRPSGATRKVLPSRGLNPMMLATPVFPPLTRRVLASLILGASATAAPLIAGPLHGQLLPVPSGRMVVGVTRVAWVDSSRKDPLTAQTGRPVVVEFWYPAAAAGAPAPYLDESTVAWFSARGTPEERRQTSSARTVRTHSTSNAVPLGGPARSLILFSHGGGMFPAQYTSLLEELASHGYIVAAITHGGLAPVLIVPGDTIVMSPDRPLPPAEMNQAIEGRVRLIAADLQFVVQRLILGQRPPILAGASIDVERVGVAGHSIGGVAAMSLCRDRSPFVACANMDGILAGLPVLKDRGQSPSGAVLFMTKGVGETPPPNFRGPDGRPASAESWPAIRTRMVSRIDSALSLHAGRAVEVTYLGAQHRSFSDFALLPESAGGASGGPELVAMMRRTLLTFFDRELRGERSRSFENLGPPDRVKVRLH
jgi:hypothetical protein